jgi:hypothetical protein
MNTKKTKSARMLVPKLVKNGFNSSFGVLVSFEGMDSEWITETVVNGKK